MVSGWEEISQLKFFVFWLSDPLGLHLGNALGLLRGNSNWAQLADFVRYPIISGHATYLSGWAHGVLLTAAVTAYSSPLVAWARGRRGAGRLGETAFALAAGCLGFGALLTLTGVNIRRYYMMASFPLEFVFLAWVALRYLPARWARSLLAVVWACELFVSACFVGYVHVHEGAPQGDYGVAYHKVIERRAPSPPPLGGP
jgi:hypothetical protein